MKRNVIMNDSLNVNFSFKDMIDASAQKLMSCGYLSTIDIFIEVAPPKSKTVFLMS